MLNLADVNDVVVASTNHSANAASAWTCQSRPGSADGDSDTDLFAVVEEVAGCGIWLLERGARCRLTCSEGLLCLYALTAEELLATPDAMTARIHPDDRAGVASLVERALEQNDPFQVLYRTLHPSGKLRWLEASGRAALHGPGCRCVVGVVIDVTERVTATDALLSAERQCCGLSEASFDAVLCARAVRGAQGQVEDFELVELNARARVAFSRSSKRLEGASLSSVLSLVRQPRLAAALLHVVETGEAMDELLADAVPELEATAVRMRAVAVGEGLVICLRDASLEQTLAEQISHAQRMEAVGRLAGGIAHDFNNMLCAVIGFGTMARDSLPPTNPAHRDVTQVLKAAERTAALTRQLLAFSRKQMLDPCCVHLAAVLTDLERLMERLIGEDIRVELDLDAPVGAVWVDVSQIEQVIMNLVVNARDAMPDGGVLRFELSRAELDAGQLPCGAEHRPGGYVQMTVSDSGIGMTPEVKARIFEPFFTTKPVGEGTGLGLSTVYGIIKQSGGHIEVDSELGVGTTFRVFLPRATSSQRLSTRPPASVHSPVLSGTETILLVEDDEFVRHLARRVLSSRGYRVLEAANAGEAFMLSEQHEGTIDLLLTDVVMPRVSGVQLARRMKAAFPRLAILCMSGYSEPHVGQPALEELGAALLRKPITPEGLLLKVRETLALRSLNVPSSWPRITPEDWVGPSERPGLVYSDVRSVAGAQESDQGKKVG
ncbi:MAG: response regulator [Polyangiaceae bacterium]|nr:response regulator [Polyangiaceae bacterium]